jgi:hypothetical protein
VLALITSGKNKAGPSITGPLHLESDFLTHGVTIMIINVIQAKQLTWPPLV